MGDGEHDAEDPAGHPPLPPDDRIWRHPAEVAMAARQTRARRKARRRQAGAALVGGALVVSGLVLVTSSRTTDPGPADTAADHASDAAPTPQDLVGDAALSESHSSKSPSTTSPTDDSSAGAGSPTTGPAPTDVEDDDEGVSPTDSHPPQSDRATPDSANPNPADPDEGDPGTVDPDQHEIDPSSTVDPTDEPGPDPILIHSSTGGEPAAGALAVRAGYVATSRDALDGATEVVVTWGSSNIAGSVVGHDSVTGLSIIRIEGTTPGTDLTDSTAAAGDEVHMRTGDGEVITQRVVAAVSTSANLDGEPLVGVAELDGRRGEVPPGTPAFASNGQVVGVIIATAPEAPAAFIPIGVAREVADEIIDLGRASHPWLGVTARDSGPGDSIDDPGSLVTFVSPDGPAAAGGMRRGDLVMSIDDRPVVSMAEMVATLRSYDPGDTVDIVVLRDGDEVDCRVELDLRAVVES